MSFEKASDTLLAQEEDRRPRGMFEGQRFRCGLDAHARRNRFGDALQFEQPAVVVLACIHGSGQMRDFQRQ